MTRPLTNADRRHRERWIVQAEREIVYKTTVRDRHAPGTAYHTRAQREINSIKAKITRWRNELCGN
jgi:hypothetical protein